MYNILAISDRAVRLAQHTREIQLGRNHAEGFQVHGCSPRQLYSVIKKCQVVGTRMERESRGAQTEIPDIHLGM